MRARRPTRGPRTRVETREVRVILHPARFPSRLSTARRRRGRRSDPNRDFAGGGPYRHPNDRSPRGALRGSAWFPARASRARASGSSTSVVARRSAFARDADASSSSLPPASDQAAARDLSRRQRTGPRLHARALTVEDWNPWTRVAANPGGHPPLRVHEDDDVPLASRTAPEGGLVHFAAQVGGALRRTRSKTGSGSLERRGGAPRRTPRKAAASPAMAVPAPTATRGTPVPPTRRNTTSATAPQVPPSLGRSPPPGASIALPPASIQRADRPSAPPEAAARSTTPWVSAAVSNSPATPSCVASSR